MDKLDSGQSEAQGPEASSPSPPQGKWIYAAFTFMGIGYLLPTFSISGAIDFYQQRFVNSTIMLDMVAVRQVFFILGYVLNNSLVESVTLTWRILSAYVIFLLSLTFLTLTDVTLQLFSRDVAYAMTLLVTALTSIGLAVQQSSYYGYATMLPAPSYVQGLTVGEAICGLISSALRILTKLMLTDERINTIIFYLSSTLIIVLCCVVFLHTKETKFVTFYVQLCQDKKETSPAQTDGERTKEQIQLDNYYCPQQSYGSLTSDLEENEIPPTSPEVANHISYGTTAGDNDRTSANRGSEQADTGDDSSVPLVSPTRASVLKAMLQRRVSIIGQIYKFMLLLAVSTFVSVSLFPGITSEVVSCQWGSWMPVALIALYNLGELISRTIVSLDIVKKITSDWLVPSTLMRFAFFPLVLLCCLPRPHPILSGEAWPCVIVAAMGFTSGLVFTVTLSSAPSRVSLTDRELCGNTMLLASMLSMLLGVAMSYILNSAFRLSRDHDVSCSRV